MNRRYSICVVVLLTSVVFACAPLTTLKGYPGPELPADKVSIVELDSQVGMARIDGNEVANVPFLRKKIAVLPGKHEIEVFVAVPVGAETVKTAPATLSFNAMAGRVYRVASGKVVALYRGKDGTETIVLWNKPPSMVSPSNKGLPLVGVAADLAIIDVESGTPISESGSSRK